jgi:hypothetical protein
MANGESNEMKGRITWPMDPSKILLSLCKYDPDVYKRIYVAQIEYLKGCLELEKIMYDSILGAIK